jgi:hypothetical protein
MHNCTHIKSSLPSGIRLPPDSPWKDAAGNADCDAGFCVGPHRCYPTTVALDWYAEFDVPPLPKTFDANAMTDYIYFNIFFGYGNDHDNPNYPACLPHCSGDGFGRFNQFVPQLMLGSALCNSTNEKPDPTNKNRTYSPKWCHLESWAIGAQYFFAEYGFKNHTGKGNFIAHAATGDLIYVKEGETVYTRFARTEPSADNDLTDPIWTLTMGVKGDRVPPSKVVATKPFMGVIPEAQSWGMQNYDVAYAGSCWELYGLSKATDYPPYMHYRHTFTAPKQENFWQDWGMDEGNLTNDCRTMSLSSAISPDGAKQEVSVNATILL